MANQESVELWFALDANIGDSRRLWALRNQLSRDWERDGHADVTRNLFDVTRPSRPTFPGSDYPSIAQVAGHVLFLFGKVAQFATDGNVSGITPDQLEAWAGWTGTPGSFAKHFILLWTTDGVIDGWRELNDALIQMREAASRRRDAARERKRRQRDRNSGGGHTDVTRDNGRDIRRDQSVTSRENGDNIDNRHRQIDKPPTANGGEKSTDFSTLRAQAMLQLNAVRDCVMRNGANRPCVDTVKVKALGEFTWGAFQDVGGSDRILSVVPRDVQYLIRDFTNAYIARVQGARIVTAAGAATLPLPSGETPPSHGYQH